VFQLEKVLNGACFSPLRGATTFGGSTACPRCGKLEADALHEYWECPANSNINEAAIHKTQIHITQAHYESVHYPCLWLRGILPQALAVPIPPCSDYDKLIHTYSSQPPLATWPGGQYFGDGSGGEYTSHPELRRCGVGLACYDHANQLLFEWKAPLLGEVQTVFRAEMLALLICVSHVVAGAVVYFYTDNLGVFNAYYKGRAQCHTCINQDLLRKIYIHVDIKNITLTVKWMPSHLDTDPSKNRPAFVTTFHVEGNALADKLAAEAASSNQVDKTIADKHIKQHKLVKAIQLRLATICLYLPKTNYDKASTNKEPSNTQPTITELMVLSAHNLFVDHNNYLVCSTCHSKCHNSNCQANRDFILSQCICPIRYNANHFTPINIPASLGHLKTHPSHSLHCYNGVFFCTICGCFAQQKLKNLATQCSKVLLQHGRRVLDALAKHRPPPPLLNWPDITAPANLVKGDISPLDPGLFSEIPPEDFSGWTSEALEAYDALLGSLTDIQADNHASYHT